MKAEPGHDDERRHASWFDDPEQILGVLRETDDHWGRTPPVPGYENLVEIGRGGQAVVYRAGERWTGREVAIKVLRDGAADTEATRRRFEREVELASSLRHPYLVRIEGHGTTTDGRLFCVMDHVRGVPIDKAPFDGSDDVVATFIEVCDAVHHAHLRGIMHRDLKPANILIDETGAPRVLDFGLARAAPGAETTTLARVSETGQFIGSLAWASPEQLTAEPDRVDVRSDVYALGAVLYQLLTGRLPHDVSGPLDEVIEQIVRRPVRSPRSLAPDLDDDLSTIVLRCLAKDPERRYQTAGDLAHDLERYRSGEAIEAKRHLHWRRMQAALRRSRLMLGSALAILLVVLGFGVVMGVLFHRASTAEALAATRLDEVSAQQQRSEAVTARLEGVLLSIDPTRVRDGAVQVDEVLDEAAAALDDDAALDDAARGRLELSLARVNYHLGRLEPARKLADAARERLAALPEGDVDGRAFLASAVLVQGLVDQSAGDIGAAELRLREAIALRHAALGDSHPDSILALLHYANLRAAQGRYDEARGLYEWIMETGPYVQGTHSALATRACFRLGQLEFFLREPAAEAHLRQALRDLETLHGAESLATADCQRTLARLLAKDGATQDEALVHARRAEDAYVRLLGPDDIRVASALAVQAVVAARQDDLPTARASFTRGIDIAEHAVGRNHQTTAHLRERYGTTLYERGFDEEAEPLLRAALESYLAIHPPDHTDVALTRGYLGCCIARAGRPDEARRLLEASRAALIAQHGDGHPLLRHISECLDRLGPAASAPTPPRAAPAG